MSKLNHATSSALALAATALIPCAAHAQCMYEIAYSFEGPGCFGSPQPLSVADINDHNVVVGRYLSCATSENVPWIWSPEDGLRALNVPPGYSEGRPAAINNHGVVVGRAIGSPSLRACVWTADSTFIDLGLPDGISSAQVEAVGINDNGMIAGNVGVVPTRWHLDSLNAEMLDLDEINGLSARAAGIDRLGRVYGWIGRIPYEQGPTDLFIWDGDEVTVVLTPPEAHSIRPNDISPAGNVAGILFYEAADCAPFPGCVEFGLGGNPNGLYDLGAYPKSSDCSAWAVNDAGQYLGACSFAGVLLWQHGDITPLIDFIVGGVEQISSLSGSSIAINDRGSIAVKGSATSINDRRTYVLVPIDRPQGDVNIDCAVDWRDLLRVLSQWGDCAGSCLADVDDDATVGSSDLLQVLLSWSG